MTRQMTRYTIDPTASVYLMDASDRLQSIIAYDETGASALAGLKRLVG
jgi:cytochrome oxidase Cu insertion factor (SCO1/SenC/PrrC family)